MQPVISDISGLVGGNEAWIIGLITAVGTAVGVFAVAVRALLPRQPINDRLARGLRVTAVGASSVAALLYGFLGLHAWEQALTRSETSGAHVAERGTHPQSATRTTEAETAPDSLNVAVTAKYDFAAPIDAFSFGQKDRRLYVSTENGYVYRFDPKREENEASILVPRGPGHTYETGTLILDETNSEVILYRPDNKAVFFLDAKTLKVKKQIYAPVQYDSLDKGFLFGNEILFFGSIEKYMINRDDGAFINLPYGHPWYNIHAFVESYNKDVVFGMCGSLYKKMIEISTRGHVGNINEVVDLDTSLIEGFSHWENGFVFSGHLYAAATTIGNGPGGIYIFDLEQKTFIGSQPNIFGDLEPAIYTGTYDVLDSAVDVARHLGFFLTGKGVLLVDLFEDRVSSLFPMDLMYHKSGLILDSVQTHLFLFDGNVVYVLKYT